MSEQTQEPSAPDESGEQDEEATPIQAPDEQAPDESQDALAEEEEAHESEEVEGGTGELGDEQQRQAEGLSQKQLEAAFGKLERETERHAKRVAEIMGEDAAMLEVCPLCDPFTPGFVMPTPATPERFPAVRTFMGDAQPRQLKPDPDAAQCDACGGEGLVDTGSHVQGQEALPCKRCDGFGWTGPRRQSTPTPVPTPVAVAESNGPATVADTVVKPDAVREAEALGYVMIAAPGR